MMFNLKFVFKLLTTIQSDSRMNSFEFADSWPLWAFEPMFVDAESLSGSYFIFVNQNTNTNLRSELSKSKVDDLKLRCAPVASRGKTCCKEHLYSKREEILGPASRFPLFH